MEEGDGGAVGRKKRDKERREREKEEGQKVGKSHSSRSKHGLVFGRSGVVVVVAK